MLTSHSRTTPSAPPLATKRPSTESATPQTAPVWPSRLATSRPVLTSHSRTVPSALALATKRPSADSAKGITLPVKPDNKKGVPPVPAGTPAPAAAKKG